MKTLTQKTNDFLKANNLPYSLEIFNTIYNKLKNEPINILEEKTRVSKLNLQPINENYNYMANICYSKK